MSGLHKVIDKIMEERKFLKELRVQSTERVIYLDFDMPKN